MKNKLTISIVAILAAGSFAFAQPSFQDGCKMQQQSSACAHSKMNNMNIFGRLDLSDAQKSAMEQNRKTNFQNMKYQYHNRIKMSNYLSIHGFDKVRFVRDRTQMAHGRAVHMADAFSRQYAILTPMQKKEFIKQLKDKETNMSMRMSGQGPRSGGCNFKR
ncbi:MAG: Spy/CpxP family protein refolding chaperone [Sulfurovaceae bacterium]|nr:Spy/CpxP family protein refolding chaperone [Sulfurovaceae bacterium]